MQVTETSAEGLKREFKIVVPASEIDAQITKRLGELGRAIRIPGFRPGKVPMQLLQRRYGAAVRGEVLEHAIQESWGEAMREQNLRPALQPQVEIVSANEGADLEYKMSVELMPDMPEPEFNQLGLERLVTEVPDEDVEKAVERVAEQNRKTEPVERPAVEGDVVVADIVGRVNGEELAGSRGEGREIEIGASGFLPGFSEQLVGAKAGDERKVTVTFPETYGELSGKEAEFDVTVKEVREKQPAKIDDDLAKEIGLENLDELRAEIRDRMRRDYDTIARQRMKRALLDKLAERYDFGVPPGMVEMEFNSIWSQYQGQKAAEQQRAAGAQAGGDGPVDGSAVIAPEETALEGAPERSPATAEAAKPHPTEHTPASHHAVPHPGSTEEPIDAAAIIAPEETALEGASDTEPAGGAEDDEDDEKAREEYRKLAERRVRLGLLLAEVGRKNNITVTQEELNQALAQEARRHPGYERQVIDYYRKNPDAVNNLRAPIFEEKVVDFILELAKGDERKVTPQELLSLPGDEDDEETGAKTGPDTDAEEATAS